MMTRVISAVTTLLVFYLLHINAYVIRGIYSQVGRNVNHYFSCNRLFELSAKSSGKRRRRSNVRQSPTTNVDSEEGVPPIPPALEPPSNNFGFVEEAVAISLKESKLPPLAGTAADLQSKYNEKNIVQRYAEEFLAPTPMGEEPKLVKLAKTVTWGAVIILVLVEIVVSVKVGGAPFDFNMVSFGGKGS